MEARLDRGDIFRGLLLCRLRLGCWEYRCRCMRRRHRGEICSHEKVATTNHNFSKVQNFGFLKSSKAFHCNILFVYILQYRHTLSDVPKTRIQNLDMRHLLPVEISICLCTSQILPSVRSMMSMTRRISSRGILYIR